MAVSRGDALSISEVRLPIQSVVALISESIDCAETCPRIVPPVLNSNRLGRSPQ